MDEFGFSQAAQVRDERILFSTQPRALFWSPVRHVPVSLSPKCVKHRLTCMRQHQVTHIPKHGDPRSSCLSTLPPQVYECQCKRARKGMVGEAWPLSNRSKSGQIVAGRRTRNGRTLWDRALCIRCAAGNKRRSADFLNAPASCRLMAPSAAYRVSLFRAARPSRRTKAGRCTGTCSSPSSHPAADGRRARAHPWRP